MKETNDYYEVDLKQIFYGLLRRIWAIVLAAVIGGGVLFCYATFLVPPKYEADIMLYVNNSSVSGGNPNVPISSSDLTAAKTLVDTYIVILKSRTVLNEIIETADVHYNYKQLRGMLSASPVDNTEVFRIVVTSTNPKEAEQIANVIADILPEKISDIMDGSKVRPVDYAVMPSGKSSPNVTKYAVVGMLAGIVAACAIIVVRLLSDTKIHDEDYLMNTYHLPVLAVVPDLFSISKNDYKKSYTADHLKTEVNR